jgi:FkbM family methyltransferase
MPPNVSSLYRLGLSKLLGVGQFYECIIEALYASILSAGDVCIDGGVNRGQHTFGLSKAVGSSGLVIGFEALHELAAMVNQRIAEEGIHNIKIIPKAISNHSGSIQFTQVVAADAYSGIRQRKGIPPGSLASIRLLEVPCTTIDDELDRLQATCAVPRFMKLDLEGGELHALMGARRMLAHEQTFVVFENGRQESADVYGYNCRDWFDFMRSVKYDVYDLFARPFGPGEWTKHEIPWYFIAVPSSHVNWAHFMDREYPSLLDATAARCRSSRARAGRDLMKRLMARLWS